MFTRLVRISPFNAAGKRQTSFVSCDVMPEIEEDLDVEINDDDLRIDTYRSSGAGGQHINRHHLQFVLRIFRLVSLLPVRMSAQFQNKDKAMQMLKAKLYMLKQQENEEKISGIRGEVKDIRVGKSDSLLRTSAIHYGKGSSYWCQQRKCRRCA